MSTKLTHELFRGWNSLNSKVPVFGNDNLIKVFTPVRIYNGKSVGTEAGVPFYAWAPSVLLDKIDEDRLDLSGSLRIWQKANPFNEDYMKTLELFSFAAISSTPDDTKRRVFAFLLAALRMTAALRVDLANRVGNSLDELAILTGQGDLSNIWGDSGWKTLPDSNLNILKRCPIDGHSLGGMFRSWHDELFTRRQVILVQPLEADSHTEAPFLSSIMRGPALEEKLTINSSVRSGSVAWKTVSNEELHMLVWSTPRQLLSQRFEVTDMAISKRCKKLGLSQPPRGFWQFLKRERTQEEVEDFLENRGVTPPKFWKERHSLSLIEDAFPIAAE